MTELLGSHFIQRHFCSDLAFSDVTLTTFIDHVHYIAYNSYFMTVFTHRGPMIAYTTHEIINSCNIHVVDNSETNNRWHWWPILPNMSHYSLYVPIVTTTMSLNVLIMINSFLLWEFYTIFSDLFQYNLCEIYIREWAITKR